MAKDFKSAVSADKLQEILSKEITIEQFLSDFFNEKGSKPYTDFCRALASYHDEEGGSPEVREFEIIRFGFDTDKLTGEFTCAFTVYFFFGCSGINSDKRDTITWKFKIDAEDLNIAFTGEEPWVSDAY
ncbi:hypothetical protein [Mucilaginibacter sp. SP1R1]|uniref:hypothetical protein n=1 Tax=Mucilaginibacter sp. SP1R1 TaxID=2723091 RepID=UPI00161B6F0E|nr:hypothetical protein [Mucilaginibacter sp. SP1R1]MBB6147821.1 hypothetical protein [Mucilaginibacter sp. SP1R1]